MKTPAAWWRSAKRRQPGVYAYRTRQHLFPMRTEWGYVGKSKHLPSRDRDHRGTGAWGHKAKDWMDLTVYRKTIRLPWWLGWDWILLPLETLVILILRPRYNWAKNPRPGKVGPREQAQQRFRRDALAATGEVPMALRVGVELVRIRHILVRAGGLALILVGLFGWAVTR
jgi:hypothetical protein